MTKRDRKPGFSRRDRAKYQFDAFMERGGTANLKALAVVFVVALLLFAIGRVVVVSLFGVDQVERGTGPWRQFYLALLEITDPGSMTQDVDSSGWVKLLAIATGIAGIILLSTLIALLTTAVTSRLRQLRKGHSKVVLTGHTLILGWNSRVVEILQELIVANESEDNPAVVILSKEPKEEMDDWLSVHLDDTHNTEVVTRSGSPSSLVNLETVAAADCKSVIVLANRTVAATDKERHEGDLAAFKAVLALAIVNDNPEVSIVAEIHGEAGRQIVSEADPRVICVDTDELLAKIIVQTSRSSGLSIVYEELLSFHGNEIYFYSAQWPTDSTFGSISFKMRDGIPIGICRDKKVELNPDRSSALEPNDELLVISSDDSKISCRTKPIVPRQLPSPPTELLENRPERQLISGWSPKLQTIVREYADYVQSGSKLVVAVGNPSSEMRVAISELDASVDNVEVRLVDKDTTQPGELLWLEPFGYDNVIILSGVSSEEFEDSVDALTLVTLLHLQQISRAEPEDTETKLIGELLDSRNRELIAQSDSREFIISNRLISSITAQISEQAEMKTVYDRLFEGGGSELYVKPVRLYAEKVDGSWTFADLMDAAMVRGEVAVGVKDVSKHAQPDANFGIRLNPPKEAPAMISADDALVVLAPDGT